MALSRHREFQAGNVNTNFIQNFGNDLLKSRKLDRKTIAAVISAKLFSESNQSGDIFQTNSGFRVNHDLKRKFEFLWKGEILEINVEHLQDKSIHIKFLEESFIILNKCQKKDNGGIVIQININGEIYNYSAAVIEDAISVSN